MPPLIDDWCDCTETPLGGNNVLHVLAEKAGGRAACQSLLTKTKASHYQDPQILSDRIKRRGYKKAAEVLRTRFPATKKARSGHLGEILATEAVPRLFPTFLVPIKKLRWNDGRETALRGEDVIAIEQRKSSIRFLKGESKSGITIGNNVVADARAALNLNNGRPSQHAMGFIVDRLQELGQDRLAVIFEDYMLVDTIRSRQLLHMTFGFSGNDAAHFYAADINNYQGRIEQHAVCFRVSDHQAFIAAAYDQLNKYAPKS